MKRSESGFPAACLARALGLSLALLLAACNSSDADNDEPAAPPAGGTMQCKAQAHCAPTP